MSPAVLELSEVTKDYHALRPLRIHQLSVGQGDQVAVVGVDQHAAEVLVNLMTGATLPDHGEVRVEGRPTSAISDSEDWLAVVDRFGIVSERAVLLESLSVAQNLAMPFSLEIEPLSTDLRDRAIGLAQEVGLEERDWDRRLADLDGAARLRVRLGRALALDPAIVLLEHPSAGVSRADVARIGGEIRRVIEGRRSREQAPLASVTMTVDREFAAAIATRVLTLDPASGRLVEGRARGWFGRGTPSL